MPEQSPHRYAIVGTGGRHEMYRDAIAGRYSESCTLVGLCDNNAGRAQRSAGIVKATHGLDVPCYAAEDFAKMVEEQQPECIIVTSKDCTHDQYICQAMELGCDVITEKPLTTDAEKCRRILETQERTGKEIRVTFNYRYSPPRVQIKDLLQSGIIGDVLSVDFHWMLDTSHGADYFRRWHRNKENTGGLMVHKATHHFDLVNWWLDSTPETVFAMGQRKFYIPKTADDLGLSQRGERCHGCAEAKACDFYLDMAGNENLKSIYLDQEEYDGYYRDRCVFSGDIDIEDCMNLTVAYHNGAKMSYSLNAFMPWEGYTIVFNGTQGRLEHKCQESVYINADGTTPGALKKEGTWIHVFPHREPAYEIDVWEAQGGHGGGDDLLLQDLFAPTDTPDPYGRRADHRTGAWSILTGIAANTSMREGRPVNTAELVSELKT